MENNNERSRIKKVSLSSFIDVLLSLYKRGVDYVDIVHLVDEDENDTVGIHFTEEYMHKTRKIEKDGNKKMNKDTKFPANGKMTQDDIDDFTII
jgi:hypothetical protein